MFQENFDIAEEHSVFDDCSLRILSALRKIMHSADSYSRRLHAELRITTPQLVCLHQLRREPKTMSQIAASMSLGLSTVNGIADRLESRGLVKRNRSVEDKRKIFLELTDEGRELLKKSPSPLQDRLREALEKLSDLEQASIALSLERVADLMEVEKITDRP